MDMENKIYVSEYEYNRLCRVDGRMDALMSYIALEESKDGSNYAARTDIIKAIIGMCDE